MPSQWQTRLEVHDIDGDGLGCDIIEHHQFRHIRTEYVVYWEALGTTCLGRLIGLQYSRKYYERRVMKYRHLGDGNLEDTLQSVEREADIWGDWTCHGPRFAVGLW